MRSKLGVLLVGVLSGVVSCIVGGCATQPLASNQVSASNEALLKAAPPAVRDQNFEERLTHVPFASETSEAKQPPGPPSGTIPSYAPVDPTSSMDLACRPKLAPAALKSIDLFPPLSSGQKKVVAGPSKAFVLTQTGAIKRDAGGNPVLVPVGVQVLVPSLSKPNIQDITGPLGDTEYAFGPIATIRFSGDGEPLGEPTAVGPVGMIRDKDLRSMELNHIYPAFGPVGTVTWGSLVEGGAAVPLIVLQNGKVQRLAAPWENLPSNIPSQSISSAVVGQSVLGPSGEPLFLNASVTAYLDENCQALSPWTRLLLENAGVSSNYTYSNQAGVNSSPGSNPTSIIQTNETSTYGVGVGYTNKPILKQVRALLYPANARDATYRQGTFLEDFIYNGVTVNASYSYGRTLALKGSSGNSAVPTTTFNTRPYFSVGATWSMDLERLWVYATKPGARPVDAGFYYQPTYPPNDSSAYFVSPNQQPAWPRAPWDNDDRP
jgi:hypothetical protein